jgi:hypothetical protein
MIIVARCERCGMEVAGQVTLSPLRASKHFIECPYCLVWDDETPAYAVWTDVNWSEHSQYDRKGYLILKHPIEGWPPE